MKIAVDCKALLRGWPDPATNDLINRSLLLLVSRNPGFSWSFIMDRTPGQALNWIDEKSLVIKRPLPFLKTWKQWYDHQLPAILGQLQPDLFLSTSGIAARTAIPQIVWMPGDWQHLNTDLKRHSSLVRKRKSDTVAKASALIASSPVIFQGIRDLGLVKEQELLLLQGEPGDQFQPLSWSERESVKTKYSGGLEYFVMQAAYWRPEILTPVLMAFGQFKKRQQSNIRLVIAGILDEELEEKMETFRYRKELVLLKNVTDPEKIIGAAYALIAPGKNPGPVVLNAMACEVPVLAVRDGEAPAIGQDSFLYMQDNDVTAIAAGMMQLYKDENQVAVLKKKGTERLQQLQKENQLAVLFAAMEHIVHNNAGKKS